MKNISLWMHTWCEVRNFASQKFRLTPGPEVFQIWESDSSSDCDCNRGNRKSPMVLLQKWPRRLLLCRNWKVTPVQRPLFKNILTPVRIHRKTQNSAGDDSGSVATSVYISDS